MCSSASFSSSAYRSGVRPFKNSSGTGAGGASEEGPARPRAEVAAARRGAAARRSDGARADDLHSMAAQFCVRAARGSELSKLISEKIVE